MFFSSYATSKVNLNLGGFLGVCFENTPFSIKILLILLISAFFEKNQHFLVKNSTFTQSNSVRAVLVIS